MRLMVNFIVFFVILGIFENSFPANVNLTGDYNWLDGFGARGTDDRASIMAAHDGSLFMFGDFTSIGDNIIKDLARYDGTTWYQVPLPYTYQPSASRFWTPIWCMTSHNGDLFAGGNFEINGQWANIARFDGNDWHKVYDANTSCVYDMEELGDSLAFLTYYYNYYWHSVEGPFLLHDTTVIDISVPVQESYWRNIIVHDHQLYLYGRFSISDLDTVNVAVWTDNQWVPLLTDHSIYIADAVSYGNELIIAGLFSEINGSSVNNLASWDGQSWHDCGQGLSGEVTLLSIYNGQLIAVTDESVYCRNNDTWDVIGEINGQSQQTYDVYSGVRSLVEYDNNLIVGGVFGCIGSTAVSNVARWDGTSWTGFGGGQGLNFRVSEMLCRNKKVLVEGEIYAAGETAVDHYAYWTGDTWQYVPVDEQSFHFLEGQPVRVIKDNSVDDRENYTDFVRQWNGTEWQDLAEMPWIRIAFIEEFNGSIVLAGRYYDRVYHDTRPAYIWNGTEWEIFFEWDAILGGHINRFYDYDSLLFVVGYFYDPANVPGARDIAAWDGLQWHTYGYPGYEVTSMGLFNNEIYIQRKNLGWLQKWDAASEQWILFVEITGQANVFLEFQDQLIVAGSFSSIGGIEADNIAIWDGSEWYALGSGIDGTVEALSTDGDRLYVGGDFGVAGGKASSNFAVWDPSIVTGIFDDENQSLPQSFILNQNYPNPFNPSTSIEYSLRQRTNVELSIYNILGRRVIQLVYEEQPAGNHRITWDGCDSHRNHVASGIYFYRINTGETTAARKMILLR